MSAGRLFLIPTPLGPEADPLRVLPPATVEIAAALDYFVAEHARSARAVLRRLPLAHPLQSLEIRELNEHTPDSALPGLLEPVLAGRDTGLLSEAGCPAVADPGAALVALAHRRGVRVVPLVGPSSLLLALMASGMNGQQFAFAGYVPAAPAPRAERLRQLERRSATEGETVLLIETPYRAQSLLETLLQVLAPDTLLGVAAELTLPGESVTVRTMEEWRRRPPTLPKVPAVFTLQAPRRARSPVPLNAAAAKSRRR
jgi:16S rRNA (cytidine1402-2'-O)-methyltransferase